MDGTLSFFMNYTKSKKYTRKHKKKIWKFNFISSFRSMHLQVLLHKKGRFQNPILNRQHFQGRRITEVMN